MPWLWQAEKAHGTVEEKRMSDSKQSVPSCPYCGCIPHDNVGQCPNVKSIEYFADGRVKRVEKHAPQQHVHLSADDLWDISHPRRS